MTTVDTGFGDVLAGEVYTHPEITIGEAPPQEPHVCANAAGGTRCDVCFGPVTVTVKEEPPCPELPIQSSDPSPPSAAPSAIPPTSTPASPPSTKSALTLTPSLPSAGLSPAGVQAAKALIQLPDLSWPELSKLARDIAMDIKDRNVILMEHKLNQVQYDFLEANNEFYRNALTEACRQWHAPLSTQERIKVEAAAILEDSLLGIGSRMQNKGEGLPGVIEAAKLFAKIADVGEQRGGLVSSGERFVINIDLGGDQKISLSAGGQAPAVPANNSLRAISSDGEGS